MTKCYRSIAKIAIFESDGKTLKKVIKIRRNGDLLTSGEDEIYKTVDDMRNAGLCCDIVFIATYRLNI